MTATTGRGLRGQTGPLWWAGQLVAWLVIIAALGALAIAVVVPRLGGATPYTIMTGSMRPEYPPGTLVVMRPAKVQDIAVGSVVTYQLSSGKSTVVTHRVAAIRVSPDGKRLFTTRGDANTTNDAKLVRPVQIRGELWYSVPYLGYVNKFISGKERRVVLIAVEAFLILYAAFMLTSALIGRRREKVPA